MTALITAQFLLKLVRDVLVPEIQKAVERKEISVEEQQAVWQQIDDIRTGSEFLKDGWKQD